MPLNIKDPETDRLARQLAGLTDETITEAVRTALRDRLEREGDERVSKGSDSLLSQLFLAITKAPINLAFH